LAFSLLGPLEARLDGEVLPLGGPRQRAVLALLLLHANESVSRGALIEGVWGDRPPSTVGAALNVHLSKLRKLLTEAPDAALVTDLNGYTLRIDPERLDLYRFERLLREGRSSLTSGNPEEASAALDQALALWRGEPLAELALGPNVESSLGRLVELRLSGLEDSFEAALQLGRHAELVPELEPFVRGHPLREHARAQLMVALYRSGRQSEALQAYREVRALLAGELGLDPGPELQRLERAILVQDSSLAVPSREGGIQRLRARRVPAAAVVAVVAVAAVLTLGPSGPRTEEPVALVDAVVARASDVAVVQPDTNKVVGRVPVGSSPALIREGDGSVWVADQVDLTVTEIDPESRRVLRTIGIGFRPDELAARNGAVWAFDREDHVLARLGRGQSWDRFERPEFADIERMAVDDDAVWLAGGRRLIRVDATSGEVVSDVAVPVHVDGLATAGDDVWAVSGKSAAVLRIDPRTSEIRDRIPMAGAPRSRSQAIAVSADTRFVWVLNRETATVTRIDPNLHDVVETYRLGVGHGSLSLAAGAGSAWVSNSSDGTVTRIDGETNEVASIAVSAYFSARSVTVAGGLVWVSVDDDSAPQ
jgi:DNA-binding SARP family transcriptional activator/streptogramin lyase